MKKIFNYKRDVFKDGILIMSSNHHMSEDKLLGLMNRKNQYAFDNLLAKWNMQGSRPNINNMTYSYTEIKE